MRIIASSTGRQNYFRGSANDFTPLRFCAWDPPRTVVQVEQIKVRTTFKVKTVIVNIV